MTRRKDFGVPSLDLRISWTDYFRAFVQEHGETGDWAMSGGRFWFRDGWSYSAVDHRGPEFPPPEDPAELRAIRERYWRGRRRYALAELKRATFETEETLNMVRARPGLLRKVTREGGGEATPLRNVVRDLEHTIGEGMAGAGLTVKVSKRVSLTEEGLALLLEHRLESLKLIVAECDRELEELIHDRRGAADQRGEGAQAGSG